MTTQHSNAIRKAKLAATKAEYSRVYDNMCLPPCDIEAEADGRRFVRRAWTGPNTFGWSRWMEIDKYGRAQ